MSKIVKCLPTRFNVTLLMSALGLIAPGMAQAYVGPGAGLTAIGSVLALVAALGLALVGFVWYPLKRLLRRKNSATASGEITAGEPK
ncbi:hypothetical protein [Amaricoccus macauensis]|uniref:hypothetical protein n=1 Tax=Amaricoccus macauensis TaxID=57001 RepID=UPI003C79B9E9